MTFDLVREGEPDELALLSMKLGDIGPKPGDGGY